jgi:hypothetical protein
MFSNKLWEELIIHFPLIQHGSYKNDASNNSSTVSCVFIDRVMFLQSRR